MGNSVQDIKGERESYYKKRGLWCSKHNLPTDYMDNGVAVCAKCYKG